MIALVLVFTLGVLGIKLTHFFHRVSELRNEIHAQQKRMVMEQAHCAVRFSLGPETTGDDIDYVLGRLQQTLSDTLSLIRFVGCR